MNILLNKYILHEQINVLGYSEYLNNTTSLSPVISANKGGERERERVRDV